jgi:hypothetical protein
MKKKVGRPKLPKEQKKVPLTVMVHQKDRSRLRKIFKNLANERGKNPM